MERSLQYVLPINFVLHTSTKEIKILRQTTQTILLSLHPVRNEATDFQDNVMVFNLTD